MARMTPKARVAEICSRLEPVYGHLSTGLVYTTPLELLIATILSAQCTDERVNLVTPALFGRYRDAIDFADANREDLETLVKSCGFYRNKAKNIQATSRELVERFGGHIWFESSEGKGSTFFVALPLYNE